MRRWVRFVLVLGTVLLAATACGGDDGGQDDGGQDDGGLRDGRQHDTAVDVVAADGLAADAVAADAVAADVGAADGVASDAVAADGLASDAEAADTTPPLPDTGCQPACAAKSCGDDGCGGSCGACYNAQGAIDNSLCRADGTCVCVSVCGGRSCGDDGCGGSCGTCADYQQCTDGACVGEPPCGGEGITVALQQTTLEDAGNGNKVFVHREYNATSLPVDVFGIEDYLYAPYNGPTAPGVYNLSGQNYEDCGLCLVGYTGCSGTTCAKRFFMKSGTLEIVEYGGAGGRFKGVVNAVLEEVTINPDTAHSTPVVGGETWCFTDLAIDEAIVAPAKLGEAVGDFTLSNCYGEPLQFSSLKTSRAIWITVVAGWCPSCAEWLPEVAATVKQLKAAGERVSQITVLGEDANSLMPSEAYCVGYAEDHDLDPADVYIDFQYGATFSHIDPYLSPSGEFSIPWDVLVKGAGLVYTWHSRLASSDLVTELTALLNGN